MSARRPSSGCATICCPWSPCVRCWAWMATMTRPSRDVAEEATVVVTTVGSSLLGIVVDEVFDTEEIVVKPVAPILRHITMFSGNTILGDGSVIMILDPDRCCAQCWRFHTQRRQQCCGAAKIASAAIGGTGGHAAVPGSIQPRRAGSAPQSGCPGWRRWPISRIEPSGGGFATQYRGQLMPLIAMGPEDLPNACRRAGRSGRFSSSPTDRAAWD